MTDQSLRILSGPELARQSQVPVASKATLKEAAREFEGLLMRQLFQALRKTVEPSGLLGDSGGARGTYEYLLDQAVVDQSLASGKTWGLAEKLERAWTEQQGHGRESTGGRAPERASR